MHDNPQLALARGFIEHTGVNLFLTGKAGTGKTTFLRQLRERSPKRMIVVAPTGVAAINAGGVTMHSFFQLPFGIYVPDPRRQAREVHKFNKTKIAIIKSMDLLVIDEISMVRADLLDSVDEVLRRYRDRDKPFGGVQLLMIGDLQQLAPVIRDDEWEILKEYYASPYFFDSTALRKTEYASIELTHIYRQSDRRFIDLLARVRQGRIDRATLDELNALYRPGFDPPQHEGYVTLTSHNHTARRINDEKLRQIAAPEYAFEAAVTGNFPEYMYPTERTLRLREGAQVMFARNDHTPQKRYVNGTIGTIIRIDSDRIEVQPASGGQAVCVEQSEWENTRYGIDPGTKQITEEVDGVYRQYPLKLAWAITIHKSQGLTFDRAVIDAAGSFSHGQVYVALSRCRTLEGVVLRTPLSEQSIINDDTVGQFTKGIEENQPTDGELERSKQLYFEALLLELFDFSALFSRLRSARYYINDHFSGLYPKLSESLASASEAVGSEIVEVGQRFREQIRSLMTPAYATDPRLHNRVVKGSAYFREKCTALVTPLLKACKVDTDNKELKKGLGNILSSAAEQLQIKLHTLEAAAGGFDVRAFLEAKGKASAGKTKPADEKIRTPKTEKIDAPSDDLLNPGLFRVLRQWRLAESRRTKTAAFLIASQKALIGIANAVPSNKRELFGIKGIGKVFVEKYGTEVMALIDDFRMGRIGEETENDEPVILDDEQGTAEEKQEKEPKPNTREATLRLFNAGQSVEEIAQHRGLTPQSVEGHLARYVASSMLDVSLFLAPDELDEMTGCLLENRDEKLSAIKKELLGDRYSYTQIKYALSHLESRRPVPDTEPHTPDKQNDNP